MGRSPCCDKNKVKKGPWSPEEDSILKSYIHHHNTPDNWISLPHKIGLNRCGKSCRLRWLNYLRPNLKHGGFSEEEDNIIYGLYINIGSRWSIIATKLSGRTDNDIKNYWNTKLKKKVQEKQLKLEQQHHACRRIKQEIRKTENESNFNQAMNINVPYIINANNFQYPCGILHANHMNSWMNDSFSDQLPKTNCANDFEGFKTSSIDQLDEIVFNNSPSDQELDDLLCEVGMYNGSNGSGTNSSIESSTWGNISSLIYPPTGISESP